MEELPKETVKRLLNSLPPHQAKYVEALLKGKVEQRIKCMSEDVYEGTGKNKTLVRTGCKGRIIGYIGVDGSVREVYAGESSYLLAHRKRFDGFWGFQCACGNDSRLCKQEIGNKGMEENHLTKEDIVSIMKKVDRDKPDYPIKNGKQNIDNFIVEDVE